ncbi:MAG: hypothetical protein KKH72_02630 [Alphaproteobacteria bacterium]|nr:hypothetical protein [Alphaproteobacteria bacterium]
MNSKIVWLRIAYWAGAIADAVMVVAMMVPELNRILVLNEATEFEFTAAYQFAMVFGASLMAGWTVLLIWADRKPVERRGVLLITVFPVIIWLNGSKIMLYASGILTGPVQVFSVVAPLALLILMLFAYFNSRRGEEGPAAA